MRFGIVLPTWCYNEKRRELLTQAFHSLGWTKMPSERPHLALIVRGEHQEAYQAAVNDVFFTEMVKQPETVSGTEQTLAFGTQHLLNWFESITHIVWMGDDALFNPNWLIELEALINRHPNAMAWSVYRSAHERFHAPLEFTPDGLDVRVKSICGHGMTFSRKEWADWGIDWKAGVAWPNPEAGDTLDLHHAYYRQGERWVTKKSYVQHTGREGLHCTPDIPEYAQEFVGEHQ